FLSRRCYSRARGNRHAKWLCGFFAARSRLDLRCGPRSSDDLCIPARPGTGISLGRRQSLRRTPVFHIAQLLSGALIPFAVVYVYGTAYCSAELILLCWWSYSA